MVSRSSADQLLPIRRVAVLDREGEIRHFAAWLDVQAAPRENCAP